MVSKVKQFVLLKRNLKPRKFLTRTDWHNIRSAEKKKIMNDESILYNDREKALVTRMGELKHMSKRNGFLNHNLTNKEQFKNELRSESLSPMYHSDLYIKPVSPKNRYKGIKDWKYIAGDRVVIINKDYPGFGTVTEITETLSNGVRTNAYKLKNGGPQVLSFEPKILWQEAENRTSYFTDAEGAVQRDDIKLVYEDPETKKLMIVDDVDFTEEKYYIPQWDSMNYKRFVKHHPEIVLDYPKKKIEDGDFSTPKESVMKVTYQPNNFFDSGIPDGIISGMKGMKTLDQALRRMASPKIRNALIGEFDFPKTPAQRSQEHYKNQVDSIKNLRAEYFNDKVKIDIGKKIFEKLNADIA